MKIINIILAVTVFSQIAIASDQNYLCIAKKVSYKNSNSAAPSGREIQGSKPNFRFALDLENKTGNFLRILDYSFRKGHDGLTLYPDFRKASDIYPTRSNINTSASFDSFSVTNYSLILPSHFNHSTHFFSAIVTRDEAFSNSIYNVQCEIEVN